MTAVHYASAMRRDRTAGTAPTPIAALHQRVADSDPSVCGDKAAFQTVLAADAVLTSSFPSTLSPVIEPLSWTEYPPVDYPAYGACAVAYLGSADTVHGWWLHYTQHHDQFGEPRHVLTLIAPCSCGAYLFVEIPDEDALSVMLDELDTAPGAPVTCDHTLRIRSASYADQTHASFELPF